MASRTAPRKALRHRLATLRRASDTPSDSSIKGMASPPRRSVVLSSHRGGEMPIAMTASAARSANSNGSFMRSDGVARPDDGDRRIAKGPQVLLGVKEINMSTPSSTKEKNESRRPEMPGLS